MVAELMKSNWFTGTKFLWDWELIAIQGWPEFIIGEPDVGVLKTTLLQRENFLDRLSRLLDWNRALNIIVSIKHMVNKFQSGHITVTERESAFSALIRAAQRETWEEELKLLNKNHNKLPKNLTLSENRLFLSLL